MFAGETCLNAQAAITPATYCAPAVAVRRLQRGRGAGRGGFVGRSRSRPCAGVLPRSGARDEGSPMRCRQGVGGGRAWGHPRSAHGGAGKRARSPHARLPAEPPAEERGARRAGGDALPPPAQSALRDEAGSAQQVRNPPARPRQECAWCGARPAASTRGGARDGDRESKRGCPNRIRRVSASKPLAPLNGRSAGWGGRVLSSPTPSRSAGSGAA